MALSSKKITLVEINEVPKVPTFPNEVHWRIEHRGLSFLLTGASVLKLQREQVNLLGAAKKESRRHLYTPTAF